MKEENRNCVLACDMGGSYIKAACVLEDGTFAGRPLMIPSCSDGSLEAVLESWATVFHTLLETVRGREFTILGIGISTPGPFDYRRKMSFMQHKFKSIYGIDLEKQIRGRVTLPDVPVEFIQDANAYLLGEQHFGAARGSQNCACVTLGTGLGIAVIAGGKVLTNGFDSCYIAIYRQPCGDGILEDIVSGRGICTAYQKLTGGKGEITAREVGQRARTGEQAALDAMYQFGAVLGRGVAFHLIHAKSELLIAGGQISRDFSLFEESLMAALQKDGYTGQVMAARFPDDAALYGVAAKIFSCKNST